MPEKEQPIEADLMGLMSELAGRIDKFLNPNTPPQPKTIGFTLLVFKFGEADSQRMNYISNAKRPEMITSMREFLENFPPYSKCPYPGCEGTPQRSADGKAWECSSGFPHFLWTAENKRS